MNDERLLNEEQLRLATSRTLPAGVSLDAETTAMREGFVALGRSLEVTSGPIDEAGLVERLRELAREESGAEEFSRGGAEARSREEMKEWNIPGCGLHGAPAPRRAIFAGDWSLLVGAALAAAALIATVRIGGQWQRAERGVVAVAKAPRDTAVGTSDVPEAAPPGIGWDDPLDDEIALAEARMGQFSAGSRGVDESLFDMNQALFLLGQELLGESL